MEFLKNRLNYLAAGLIVAALAAWFVWPYRTALILGLGLAGLLALLAYVAINISSLKQRFRRRSFLYGGNTILITVLVLAILVLINYFLSTHNYRADLTAAKIHSLSDQSLTVLKNLKTDVSVKAFFREGNYGRGAMEELLKLYAYHSSRIKSEFIDPDKNPGLVKRYDVTQDGTTIFEAGGKEGRITASGEEDVTNALIKVTRAAKKVIYFLGGHGEKNLEQSDDGGFSRAKDELVKQAYDVKSLSLAFGKAFPEDCAALVVAGPEKDLLPAELDAIAKSLAKGGRVFFLVDPQTSPALTPFLAKYGFRLGGGIVLDKVLTLAGVKYFMPGAESYEPHEITRKFRYVTFYPIVQPVETIEPKPDGVETLQSLVKTGETSWIKTGLALNRNYSVNEISFDKKKDRSGPFSIAAIATLKKGAPDAAGKTPPEGRVVVFGDSDFAANGYYDLEGNGNLFLNCVNWLTEESDLISIQPRTQAPRTIQLMPAQMALIRLVTFYLLPLGILAFGLVLWLRRRSL